MLIVMSPSKTQQFDAPKNPSLPFSKETTFLFSEMKKMNEEALGKLMGIKGSLLEETYALYQCANPPYQEALFSYDGVAFSFFKAASYSNAQEAYMASHLRILSAMYGVLKPMDLIAPYRLDMTMKPCGESLYAFWAQTVKAHFEKASVIVSLASNEFERMLSPYRPKITQVVFKEKETLKTIAYRSKQARGAMAHYMILNQIEDVEGLKAFDLLGYKWSPEHSKENTLCFLRT